MRHYCIFTSANAGPPDEMGREADVWKCIFDGTARVVDVRRAARTMAACGLRVRAFVERSDQGYMVLDL